MAGHTGSRPARKGLVFHIDAADDRSFEGEPATNYCPTSKQHYMENVKVYSGTGYGFWSHYATWDAMNVPDSDYITISGEMKVSPDRKADGGQVRMYIWTASPTDGWIRSTSWGTTSTEWVPFSITLQRRNSYDTSTSANTGNGNPLYCRFGCYHYPNSKNVGSSYLRNVMISNGSEALPFTTGTRTLEFKDFFGRVPMIPKAHVKGNDTFYGRLFSRAKGKEIPKLTSSSYIPIRSWPSELNVDDNTTDRSWEVVFKTNSTASYQGVYGHKVGSGCSYYCNGGIYIKDSVIHFSWYDNSAYRWLSSGVNPVEGSYYHVVATFTGADQKVRIYVNGFLKNTLSSATNLNYGGGMLYVEAGYNSKDGGQHFFDGPIPVMKFYKGNALSKGDVKRNFHAYKGKYNI
jgi:hypothetical protein